MKERITYTEKYKKPGIRLKPEYNPVMPSLTDGFKIKEAYLLEAGTIEKNNQKLEYQIIKVLISDID